MSTEVLIDTASLDEAQWQTYEKIGLRQYVLWKHPVTGASIALLDFAEGAGIPDRHSHASNQFMYCLEGEYEYTTTGIVLRPGSFYSNPKDHPHGPTHANKRSLLIEFYDGPHYYEMPSYQTMETIGKIADEDRGA
jgi:quercetin dioxygenase-like cupin family protein